MLWRLLEQKVNDEKIKDKQGTTTKQNKPQWTGILDIEENAKIHNNKNHNEIIN